MDNFTIAAAIDTANNIKDHNYVTRNNQAGSFADFIKNRINMATDFCRERAEDVDVAITY